MLQVEKLSKSYAGILLFQNVSFTLHKGEKCALVGRNGSGKTTLFRILKGEESPDHGSVFFPKGYKLGFLDQHVQFQKNSVWEEALSELPEGVEEHEVESILFGLGFTKDLLAISPNLLSGGYHLRLKLAQVLAKRPNCLLLDEPTNYLDIVSMRWLERHLKNWPGECILISHDRDFLNSVVSHTMGLHRKQLYKTRGNLENFYHKILQEEEVYEKTRQNLEKKREHLEEYIERFGAKASKASQAQSKAKALDKLPSLSKLIALDNLCFSFSYTPFFGKKMLHIEHAFYAYEEGPPLIQDFSLEVFHGQKIAIIGKNGVGKSTLLRLISGELSPKQGSYTKSDNVKQGFFGQTHITRLDLDKTVEEEIAASAPHLPYSTVRSICGQMMFSQEASKKKLSFLSGGERSRVLLGKILSLPTNLLFLDEPTHHLDLESIESLVQATQEYKGTVFLITHSEWMLHAFNPDLLIICEGKKQKLFAGSYQDFLEKGGWEEEACLKKEKKAPPIQTPPSRSRKPLERQIALLEKTIEEEEKLYQKLEKDLADAYEQEKKDAIQNLSSQLIESQKKIEDGYNLLEKRYQELTES